MKEITLRLSDDAVAALEFLQSEVYSGFGLSANKTVQIAVLDLAKRNGFTTPSDTTVEEENCGA